MSVKWNLNAELGRQDKQDAANLALGQAEQQAFMKDLASAVLCLLFVLWLLSDRTGGGRLDQRGLPMWGFYLLLVGLALEMVDEALKWSKGTALSQCAPWGRAKLSQRVEWVLTNLVAPAVLAGWVLVRFTRPRLTWLGAVAAVAGFYVFKIWCYDRCRRRTEAAYGSLSPEERRQNKRAQKVLAALTVAAILAGVLLPETMLPGGWKLRAQAQLIEAASAYQTAEAVAFTYSSERLRVRRYHLPDEGLTVYLDPINGEIDQAWLCAQGAYAYYDGHKWTPASAQEAAAQPLQPGVLLPEDRRELANLTKALFSESYTVVFDQEALRARQITDCSRVTAEYALRDGALVYYRQAAYAGPKERMPAEAFVLRDIDCNQEAVAAALAQQKAQLSAEI